MQQVWSEASVIKQPAELEILHRQLPLGSDGRRLVMDTAFPGVEPAN